VTRRPDPAREHDDVPLDLIQREFLDDLKFRASASHHRNVKSSITKALAALNVELLGDLQPIHVIRYRNQLREGGLANRTANMVVDRLRTMLNWALGCGLIESNPLRNIRKLPCTAQHQRYRRRALTDEEIDRFLAAAEADDRETARVFWEQEANEGERWKRRRVGERVPQAPMWLGFLETGARWSEMTNTRWTDLSVESRTLVLRAETTKSKKRRVIPLRELMITALEELRAHHEQIFEDKLEDSDPIFLSPEGVPWCTATRNCMRIFDRVLVRAKIARVDAEGRKLDIHALRHTFGSRLARRGVGLVQVQRLMGHSDPKLTAQVYTHLDVEDLRRAVEAV
jgi:integrase